MIDKQSEREVIDYFLSNKNDIKHKSGSRIRFLEKDRAELELFIKERRGVIRMRKSWSDWILGAIIGVIAFDILFIILIGTNLLTFEEGLIIPIFISESLLKIFGLAFLVVKFLFNKDSFNNT